MLRAGRVEGRPCWQPELGPWITAAPCSPGGCRRVQFQGTWALFSNLPVVCTPVRFGRSSSEQGLSCSACKRKGKRSRLRMASLLHTHASRHPTPSHPHTQGNRPAGSLPTGEPLCAKPMREKRNKGEGQEEQKVHQLGKRKVVEVSGPGPWMVDVALTERF